MLLLKQTFADVTCTVAKDRDPLARADLNPGDFNPGDFNNLLLLHGRAVAGEVIAGEVRPLARDLDGHARNILKHVSVVKRQSSEHAT